MRKFSAFRQLLIALALFAASVVASSSPALARSHHGVSRHMHARYAAIRTIGDRFLAWRLREVHLVLWA